MNSWELKMIWKPDLNLVNDVKMDEGRFVSLLWMTQGLFLPPLDLGDKISLILNGLRAVKSKERNWPEWRDSSPPLPPGGITEVCATLKTGPRRLQPSSSHIWRERRVGDGRGSTGPFWLGGGSLHTHTHTHTHTRTHARTHTHTHTQQCNLMMHIEKIKLSIDPCGVSYSSSITFCTEERGSERIIHGAEVMHFRWATE